MYNLRQENRKMKLDNVYNAVSLNIVHSKKEKKKSYNFGTEELGSIKCMVIQKK